MPEGAACECGCKEFTKETDIMDVWFDSGSTWAAVCDHNPEHPELVYPDRPVPGGRRPVPRLVPVLHADLYCRPVAWLPISRSSPTAGPWTARARPCTSPWATPSLPRRSSRTTAQTSSVCGFPPADYTQDMRISKPILKQLSDAYLKIRNTCPLYPGQPDRVRPGHRPGGLQAI